MNIHNENQGMLFPLKLIFLAAGILAGLLTARVFLLPCQAPDASMEPAVPAQSYLLVQKRATPAVGDIVLIEAPGDDGRVLLLRVAAADEARVEMRSRILYVNGTKFTPPWKQIARDQRVFPLHFTKRDIMPPVRLQREEYFLTADNTDRGYDSRYFGPVHKDKIIGKVIYIH